MMWINMHFNSQLQIVQENEIAAMVDQQALRAGNYVRVIEISGASRVPHISVVPPVPLLSEIWGAHAPASSMAPAPMVTVVNVYDRCLCN